MNLSSLRGSVSRTPAKALLRLRALSFARQGRRLRRGSTSPIVTGGCGGACLDGEVDELALHMEILSQPKRCRRRQCFLYRTFILLGSAMVSFPACRGPIFGGAFSGQFPDQFLQASLSVSYKRACQGSKIWSVFRP